MSREVAVLLIVCLMMRATTAAAALNACQATLGSFAWEPIRIKTHFTTLTSITPDQAEMLQCEVLPRAEAFWERAMRVRRVDSPLLIQRECWLHMYGICISSEPRRYCGDTPIPEVFLGALNVYNVSSDGTVVLRESYPEGPGEADTDFVLFLGTSNACNVTLAFALPCVPDECGRPRMGSITLCSGFFDQAIDQQIATLIHEMTHTFGFISNSFDQWRMPDGSPRVENPDTLYYACSEESDGKVIAEWRNQSQSSSSSSAFPWTNFYTFQTGVVASIATRGLGGGSTCRCPTDPTKTYTDADLTDCLNNPGNCAFAIVTPKVRDAARAYFGCSTLEGMELENQRAPSCEIIDSHWKARLVSGEYMTANIDPNHNFVSPMSFALLEDTGWYQMDYSMTTNLVPGAMLGYLDGCAFVQQKCVSDETGAVQRPLMSKDAFCAGSLIPGQYRCSADAKGFARCPGDHGGPDASPLSQYQYRGGVIGNEGRFDMCPALKAVKGYSCDDESRMKIGQATGPSARCFAERISMSAFRSPTKPFKPACRTVKCVSSGTAYEIIVSGNTVGVCYRGGQMLRYHSSMGILAAELECESPQLICARFRYAHLPSTSVLHYVPDGAPGTGTLSDSPFAKFKGIGTGMPSWGTVVALGVGALVVVTLMRSVAKRS